MKFKKEFIPLVDIEGMLKILCEISIFGGLNDKQLYELFTSLKTAYYNEGEVVFKRGESPYYLYIVKSGKVKLAIGQEVEPLEIMELREGQCFGETSLIGIIPHTATAIASEKTELVVISGKQLMSFFDSDKDLFGMLVLNIAREISRRLHKTDDILLDYVLNNKKTSC